MTGFAAVVLAGGASRRMGGVDKVALRVGGAALLDRVLHACRGADQAVCVGPVRSTALDVVWVREDPPGGGPVAALAAALPQIRSEVVVLLAADLPFVTPACVALLAASVPAVLVDEEDRDQWLCGAWEAAALRDQLAGSDGQGARLRDLLAPLQPRRLRWYGEGRPWEDCDTQDDLERARAHAGSDG